MSDKSIIDELHFHILRSNLAYDRYLSGKQYYKALRIYYANRKVYELLERCSASLPGDLKIQAVEYLFHLEDWFSQFSQLEEKIGKDLCQIFIFDRLEGSPCFPKEFFQSIKSLL